jgi:hypothetical protein
LLLASVLSVFEALPRELFGGRLETVREESIHHEETHFRVSFHDVASREIHLGRFAKTILFGISHVQTWLVFGTTGKKSPSCAHRRFFMRSPIRCAAVGALLELKRRYGES